jgi:hypothetical protein
MASLATSALPPPAEYPPGAWLRLVEAAAYVRMTASGLRTAVHRGEIIPDGRGPRSTHMFRARTLDAFLARGTEWYTEPFHATAGDR